MQQVHIRKALLTDLSALQSISRTTFYETFADQNTASDMQQYLDNNLSDAKLTRELADPGSVFFLALAADEVIGYLKLNSGEAQTEMKDKKAVEIERLYVLRDFQGQKAGQLLYETALKEARNAGAEYLWLGVWEKNPRAIRFYEKNGFKAFDRHFFLLGNDRQTDIMMKLKL